MNSSLEEATEEATGVPDDFSAWRSKPAYRSTYLRPYAADPLLDAIFLQTTPEHRPSPVHELVLLLFTPNPPGNAAVASC